MHRIREKLFLWGEKQIERGAWFLIPLSWMWGWGAFCKNWLYDRHLLPVTKVNRPVISIGNLVAGGTGKTPLVDFVARSFIKKWNVAVISHGYGPRPDEAFLLSRRLPGARIYHGKNRKELARDAIRNGAQLLILDDGFQCRSLHRDFDFVILAGDDPFGKGHFLPRGYLRDPPSRLNQADALFVTGHSEIFPDAFQLKVEVERIVDQEKKIIASLQGVPVGMFCGIGRPQRFRKTLSHLKADVRAEWILADHQIAEKRQLYAFARRARSLGAVALVCTEKDSVKLDRLDSFPLPIWTVEIGFQLVKGQQEWEKLIAKIDQKIDNITSYE